MCQVEVRAQACTVGGLDICGCKSWVDVVEVGGRVLAAAKDRSAIDVMEDDIELGQLIWEAPIVQEYIRALPVSNFAGNQDWLNWVAGGTVMEGKHRWWTVIRWGGLSRAAG